MIKSRFLKEIKGYFSIFITFIILMIIFAHNLSFSVTCESQIGNGRTTLDHCELNNKIGEEDADGNMPITCGLKENIGKGQRDSDHLEYDPYTSPDYFYDTKNTYCLIWGLTMSIAYSTAAQIANEACDSGRVLINDKPAKASATVKEGDIITISFGNKDVKVEVLDVQETVRKEEAKELFRYL